MLTGGLNVWLAISHLGLKIRKSASGDPGDLDLAVSTQKMEGSMWSCHQDKVYQFQDEDMKGGKAGTFEILPTLTNFSIAYL